MRAPGRRFTTDLLEYHLSEGRIGKCFYGFCGGCRIDPCLDGIIGQNDRHPVVDAGQFGGRSAGQYGKMGITILKPVQTGQPGDGGTGRLDGVLVPCLFYTGRGDEMFPFVVPGRGDNASSSLPAFLPHGFTAGGLHAAVYERSAGGRGGEAPYHGKITGCAAGGCGDHGADVGGTHFTFSGNGASQMVDHFSGKR